jgi:hypothetical protein
VLAGEVTVMAVASGARLCSAGAGVGPVSPKGTGRRCTPVTPTGICSLLGKTVQMGSGCSGRRGVRQVAVTTVAVLASTWDQRVKVWVLVETWVTAERGGVMVWV